MPYLDDCYHHTSPSSASTSLLLSTTITYWHIPHTGTTTTTTTTRCTPPTRIRPLPRCFATTTYPSSTVILVVNSPVLVETLGWKAKHPPSSAARPHGTLVPSYSSTLSSSHAAVPASYCKPEPCLLHSACLVTAVSWNSRPPPWSPPNVPTQS